MKKYFFPITLALASVSMFAGNYKVTVALPSDMEGAMAYIVNYDTAERMDSVLVEDGVAEFTGVVETPTAARLNVDGSNIGMFILEDGDITINPAEKKVSGGVFNEKNNVYQSNLKEIVNNFYAATTNDDKKKYMQEYDDYTDTILNDNKDNVIGYIMLLDKLYDMEPAELENYLAANPNFTKYKRVQKLVESNKRKQATSVGNKFADFEIEYEGVKHKLSDVVGKGDYVLVDFWASWCGPCIAQTVVLKDIYKEYKDQGLKILGVAVWDEPANTQKAIVQHELPWESWLNGQNVPTDIYGISGIPCIILFGPDGTILSRDLQGDELKAAVAEAMANKKK